MFSDLETSNVWLVTHYCFSICNTKDSNKRKILYCRSWSARSFHDKKMVSNINKKARSNSNGVIRSIIVV